MPEVTCTPNPIPEICNINKWANRELIWNDVRNLTWGEIFCVCELVNEFVKIDGGKVRPVKKAKLAKKIAKFSSDKKKKLISVSCKIKGITYENEKQVNESINLTVEDIQLIIKEVVDVKIELL